MPFVPIVPGVPAIAGNTFFGVVTLLTQDALGILASFLEPQWGLFLDGEPVIVANSVVKFNFKRSASIADYPIEQGGFESYDKVQLPYKVRMSFASGSSAEARTELLASADAAQQSLDLYDCVTPEQTYINVNIYDYDYDRAADHGNGMITVELMGEEVRVNTSTQFTNTKTPDAAATQSGGTVQAQTPTDAQTQVVNSQAGFF